MLLCFGFCEAAPDLPTLTISGLISPSHGLASKPHGFPRVSPNLWFACTYLYQFLINQHHSTRVSSWESWLSCEEMSLYTHFPWCTRLIKCTCALHVLSEVYDWCSMTTWSFQNIPYVQDGGTKQWSKMGHSVEADHSPKISRFETQISRYFHHHFFRPQG